MSEGRWKVRQWKVESGKWKVKTASLKLEALMLGVSFHESKSRNLEYQDFDMNAQLFTLNSFCSLGVHA
jgi:hypothetical protein